MSSETGQGAMVMAPFTAEQVVHLNNYQLSGDMHPFTCLTDHRGGQRVLVATLHGWVCTECDYNQNWAHTFMADWPHARSALHALRQAAHG